MYDSTGLRKKRYGQFFSGKKVAELLASMIPNEAKIENMIDPMVGVGDLILAAQKRFPDCSTIYGIELDSSIIDQCKRNVPGATILNADAFNASLKVQKKGWDLVITNPPYVRYQLQSGYEDVPSREKVRSGLIKRIEQAGHLSQTEKELFSNIAKEYSGLSDLAVPSWILCASMVRIGGYLAIVVPETWLSRNYSDIIQFLLLKAFKIMTIAKDVDRKWFDDAQVRTHLIVAQRKEIGSVSDIRNDTTLCVDLGCDLETEDSLVGRLSNRGLQGIYAFERIVSDGEVLRKKGIKTKKSNTGSLLNRGIRYGNGGKWLGEGDTNCTDSKGNIPDELRTVVDGVPLNGFCDLIELGWDVGQGLRTGANDFFYGTLVRKNKSRIGIHTQEWYGREIEVDENVVTLAVKRQNEIKKPVITNQDVTNCIFNIGKQVRREDYLLLANGHADEYTVMDEALEKYVTSAEKYILPNGKRFPDLSAVKTNEKKNEKGYIRFWYMLPDLQKRHVPDICIPRVCGGAVYSAFVKQTKESPIAVDANFTTMWCRNQEEKPLMIALLNSTWFKIYMEMEGAVMGGGALKVEATHVKKVLFPRLNKSQKKKLIEKGERIIEIGNIKEIDIRDIDRVMLSSFGGNQSDLIQTRMQNLLREKLSERGAL